MHTINQGVNKFYIGDSENEPLAEMCYTNAGEKIIIIDHTFVSETLRGQKIGNLLLDRVVELAELQNKKITPLCPFAKAAMLKEPEKYAAILHK
ncbi:MAG TPA: N-acetyltransferase [Candidatus Avacidaminococcus intestinavium]|uniref:N-acetyltransferase n=1 Tax=Candidatus Avacidaminococcus intestinavium TaxID=2840684 RepID=A0A9D1SLQ7_9FIRM|nr:N-acetyltransferase [Candidatus Avacidaminococcus intestinavium]